jgi:hypothetical protein
MQENVCLTPNTSSATSPTRCNCEAEPWGEHDGIDDDGELDSHAESVVVSLGM